MDDQGQVARSRVRDVTAIEWIGVVAGVLALLASVLRWYTVTGPFADQVAGLGLPTGRTAWGAGFTAWFAVVLLVIAAALILAPHYGLRIPLVVLLWLSCALAAVVLIIIRWVTIAPPNLPPGADAGPGFGLYFGLALAVLSAVCALIAFRTWRR